MAAASAVTLPPGVKGKGRAELVVAVGNFVWQGVGKKPLTVSVLVRWWGQSTPGLVIQLPASDSTEACSFPVVVSPRHLIRYLRDMGTLALVGTDRLTAWEIIAMSACPLKTLVTNRCVLAVSGPLQRWQPGHCARASWLARCT
jgi:hypothetical protein